MKDFFALLFVIVLIIVIKEILKQNKEQSENNKISSSKLDTDDLNKYNENSQYYNSSNTYDHRLKAISMINSLSDKELDKRIKKGDEQIKRIQNALYNSEKNNDYTELIKVYEDIILKEGMCFTGDTHIMKLAELYYKTEQYDKAWNYLNELQFMYPQLMQKIRYFQVKILKKENRNIDALATLMCANLYDYNANKTGSVNIDKFKTESKTLLKKLQIDTDTNYFDYLVYLINCQLKNKDKLNSKEINLRNALKNFINDISSGSNKNLDTQLNKASKEVKLLEQKATQEKTQLNIKPGYYPEKLQAILNEQPPNTRDLSQLDKFYQNRAKKLQEIHLANISNFVREADKYSTSPITSVEKSFLKYIDSQSTEKPNIAQYWTYEYNIDYNKVINRLMDNDYLQITNYQNPSSMKVPELKKLLSKAGIKAVGNKENLIKLVNDNITIEMMKSLSDNEHTYFTLTNKGIEITQNTNSSISKDYELENKCYQLILNNEFSEAYKLICEYEKTKNIPRGIGNNWNNEVIAGLDVNKVKKYQNFMNENIDKDIPNELKLTEKSFKACIIYGEMMGAGLDKRVNMFFNINSINLAKQEVKNIMNKLCLKLWT